MKRRNIDFEFVDVMPSTREEGRLYISIKYRTAVHNCFCGCGMKVVTPIRRTGWSVTYDGDSISLSPSIGNWSFDCESHYWIKKSVAVPAGSMTTQQIDRGRTRDKAARDAYFELPKTIETRPTDAPQGVLTPEKRRSFWEWLLRRR